MRVNSDNIYSLIILNEYLDIIDNYEKNSNNLSNDNGINIFSETLMSSLCISIANLMFRFNLAEVDSNKYDGFKIATKYFSLGYTWDYLDNIVLPDTDDRNCILATLQDVFLLLREHKDAMRFIQEIIIDYKYYDINNDDRYFKRCRARAVQEETHYKENYFSLANDSYEDEYLLKIESATDFLLFDSALWGTYMPEFNEIISPILTEILNHTIYFGVRDKMLSRAVHFINKNNDNTPQDSYPYYNSTLSTLSESRNLSPYLSQSIEDRTTFPSIFRFINITDNDINTAVNKMISLPKIKKDQSEGEE